MNWQAWYTVGVIVLVMVALVRSMGPTDVVLFGGALLVGVAGIITPEQVFSGFINEGTLTIGALFIVAAAMRETGALDIIGRFIFGKARTEQSGLVRMALPVATLSAFMNNTPIVAMMLPVVSNWCRRNRISPSRLLMPLSFMAILGGTCTLIGTSTNLVINGLMMETVSEHPELATDLTPLWLFEFAYLGVPFALTGGIYLFVVGRRLLPAQKDLIEKVGESPRNYFAQMRIEEGCRLIGKSVGDAGLRRLPGLFLIEIDKGDYVITPVTPREILDEGDVLTFSGLVSTMVDLERISGLVPVADENYEDRAVERREKTLCEAVISPQSPLVGRNIRGADFRATYGAAVIAVHRGDEQIQGRIGDIVLKAGDTILLQTSPRFAQAHNNNPDFYLVSAVDEYRTIRHDKAYICVALLGVLVILMATNLLPIVLAAYLVAGLMLLARCISATVARKSIDWETLLTIGASFALGHALESSGAASTISTFLVTEAGQWGPHAMIFILYVVAGVFASFISSKAAAVLMFPIALGVALAMDVNARPMIMAIAFSTAATFATPLGYPTNLMVYGPGGYRFSDFARVGLPLNAILAVLATLVIPVVWSF